MTVSPAGHAPPRVADRYMYWAKPPPEHSRRCLWWVNRIKNERWRPGRFIRRLGYDSSAEYYGVYLWEWLHVLGPLLERLRDQEAA